MPTTRMPGFTAEAALYRGGYYRVSGNPGPTGGAGTVIAQAQDTDTTWTTDKICEACGCTVSGFQCNCGSPPGKKKLECIKNGGPSKPIAVRNRSAIRGGAVFSRL
jgi:hypothetical protein